MSAPQRLRLARRRPDEDMAAEVLRGLRECPKRIASKYFYDARGSALFERICEQPEYYLARAEAAILERHGAQIAQLLGPRLRLVEYGCGCGGRTLQLLRLLQEPAAYVPVELSSAALAASVQALAVEFPQLPVQPVCADFTRLLILQRPAAEAARTLIWFPGSTIGNFEVAAAVALLQQMRIEMGARGGALIGIDLRKDYLQLEAAYNDAAGVTAAFTLNLLERLNRELAADFELAAFRHRARYNPMAGRIETHLISLREQRVTLAGDTLRFSAGEAMLVEYSYKYTPEQFARMAARAGLRRERAWSDAAGAFSLQYLVAESGMPLVAGR